MPDRSDAPRCRVFLDGNGPLCRVLLSTVHQLDDDQTEEHPCVMPWCYSIPLTLMNKAMAFFESLRHPDGSPIVYPTHEKDLEMSPRHMCEYTYIWRLRRAFLKAIYAASCNDQMGSNWRWPKIHGYLYREYSGYGHDRAQRMFYREDEQAVGQVPYTVPDVAQMS